MWWYITWDVIVIVAVKGNLRDLLALISSLFEQQKTLPSHSEVSWQWFVAPSFLVFILLVTEPLLNSLGYPAFSPQSICWKQRGVGCAEEAAFCKQAFCAAARMLSRWECGCQLQPTLCPVTYPPLVRLDLFLYSKGSIAHYNPWLHGMITQKGDTLLAFVIIYIHIQYYYLMQLNAPRDADTPNCNFKARRSNCLLVWMSCQFDRARSGSGVPAWSILLL